MAIGLLDGAIIILDLQLGIEKYFVEKHPAMITALEFYEEKVLVSGSVDGKVNLVDLDSEDQKRVYKCQNCQDRKIPVAKIVTSDYGIAAVVDIEGNCRWYDMIRLRKICKISHGKKAWRFIPDPAIIANSEAFLGIFQTDEVGSIFSPEDDSKS